ncbi:hypothetical protein AG1IA_07427 [Rhizoctonia solani AG-1 IA]|uniref:Uncharacterized protein n=1 Tax=Thanatephorus cucumeris (strain AG1-IA) TaxID=983506 RepID=L8WKS2_THACA|nr:hypothetical protein AG1IA_07427 [Rhizoctonia solani AG-1 IA]
MGLVLFFARTEMTGSPQYRGRNTQPSVIQCYRSSAKREKGCRRFLGRLENRKSRDQERRFGCRIRPDIFEMLVLSTRTVAPSHVSSCPLHQDSINKTNISCPSFPKPKLNVCPRSQRIDDPEFEQSATRYRYRFIITIVSLPTTAEFELGGEEGCRNRALEVLGAAAHKYPPVAQVNIFGPIPKYPKPKSLSVSKLGLGYPTAVVSPPSPICIRVHVDVWSLRVPDAVISRPHDRAKWDWDCPEFNSLLGPESPIADTAVHAAGQLGTLTAQVSPIWSKKAFQGRG